MLGKKAMQKVDRPCAKRKTSNHNVGTEYELGGKQLWQHGLHI